MFPHGTAAPGHSHFRGRQTARQTDRQTRTDNFCRVKKLHGNGVSGVCVRACVCVSVCVRACEGRFLELTCHDWRRSRSDGAAWTWLSVEEKGGLNIQRWIYTRLTGAHTHLLHTHTCTLTHTPPPPPPDPPLLLHHHHHPQQQQQQHLQWFMEFRFGQSGVSQHTFIKCCLCLQLVSDEGWGREVGREDPVLQSAGFTTPVLLIN